MKLGLNEPEIFSEIADLFSKSSNLEKETVDCFEKSLSGNANQEDLWIKYAEFIEKQKNFEKAIQLYKKAKMYIEGEVKRSEVQAKIDSLTTYLNTKEHFIEF